MQTFRSYGALDDPGIVDGDTSLIGVNLYDSPENLQPGQCQEAVNMDFTSQDAVTRGGLVCIPELGNVPANYVFTQHTSPVTGNWKGVAYGDGKFVVVGQTGGTNNVLYSVDGINWAIGVGANANHYRAVCFGNGLFVAVSFATVLDGVMTSTDGVTWTARTSAANNQWSGITYGNGLFVAVANSFSGNDVMTSPDGTTWTLRTTPASSLRAVCYGGGLFVAVGGGGTQSVLTSPDGITWTARTTPSATWFGVTAGLHLGVTRYVAVATGSAMYSDDGITWTASTPAFSVISWNAVAYGDGLFVAVANVSSLYEAMASFDGVHWFRMATGIDRNQSFQGIAYGNGMFVAAATGASASQLISFTYPITVWASGTYSDPNDTSNPWIVLAGSACATFIAFGQTSRIVYYPAGYLIDEQSTVVQANNLLFIFSGPNQSPIQWDGAWGGTFIVCPVSTLGTGYEDIPFSNQATYSQNRLWVPNGKDTLSASQALDFKNFNVLTGSFNLNYGSSDYLVCSYPFGDNGLVAFKNHSSFLLQNTSGGLEDVTSTEITRQLGIIGINAITAVGPDLVYMTSDRNITSIRLNIQNQTQAITVPISQNINPIMRRVNWTYGYKVSMGYWNNLLFVALPLDNATACNTILVYNFITNQWYGEWSFADSIGMAVQGFVTANYLGQVRMHAIAEDGRVFVVNEGQNDISGSICADIETSLTTRAYVMNNDNRYNRRMFADLSTNRPNFSIRAYVDGVNEYSDILTNQTYLRSQSWRFPAPSYQMDNSDDNFNQAFRKDYSTGPDSVQSGSGFLPEEPQDYRIPLLFRRNGRLVWYRITNTTGYIGINSIGGEARAGLRNNLTEVG